MIEMDLSKATNQQLYQIAMDESSRLRDRYLAARELQRRRKQSDTVCWDRPEHENRPSDY
jgi:predicted ATPase with chaperone activity